MGQKTNRATRRQIAKLERGGMTTRQFAYSVGEVGKPERVDLNFSLRTDIPDQLEGFIKCMEAALVDVREELAKRK